MRGADGATRLDCTPPPPLYFVEIFSLGVRGLLGGTLCYSPDIAVLKDTLQQTS